jgi:hypothetical protein
LSKNLKQKRYFIYENLSVKKFWDINLVDSNPVNYITIEYGTLDQEEKKEIINFKDNNESFKFFYDEIVKKIAEGYKETQEKDFIFYQNFYQKEFRDLKNKLNNLGLNKKVFLPLIKNEQGTLTDSKIFGIPFLPNNKAWPLCPLCNNNMLLLIQLNFDTLPIEININILQMFICIDGCGISMYYPGEIFPYEGPIYVIRQIKTTNKQIEIIEIGNFNSEDKKWQENYEKTKNNYENFYKVRYDEGNSTYKKILNFEKPENNLIINLPEKFDYIEYSEKRIIFWNEKEEYPDDYCSQYLYGVEFNSDEIKALKLINEINPVNLETKLKGYSVWAFENEKFCPECKKATEVEVLFSFYSEDNLKIPLHYFGDKGFIYCCKKHNDIFLFTCENP